MSQTVAAEIIVVGMAGVLQALVDCGLAWKEQHELRATDGQKHAVDLVATDEEGTQLGVKVDAKTGVASFVSQDCSSTKGKALANRIAQRYAYSQAVEELRRKGYRVETEEKLQDGSIRLVAQRWR